MKHDDDKFKISEIEPRNRPIQTVPTKKTGGGFAALFGRRNLPKTLIIISIIVIIVAVVAIIWGRGSFSLAKIDLSIEASGDIASGEEITITVFYKNNNRVNLNDTYLIINYPVGTFSVDGEEIFQEQIFLDTIFRKSGDSKEFKIRFIGEKEDIKNITAKLNFKPQNINSRFEKETSFRAEINEVLIKINIEGSEKIISGEDVSYLVGYENKTDKDINNLEIRLEYSDDFELEDAEPKSDDEDYKIWKIGTLKSDEKKEIKFRGTLTGEEGESKILRVVAGKVENGVFLQYSKSEHNTQIASSPLLLLLEVRGFDEDCSVDAGKWLDYKIKFRNNTDVALEELILKAYFKDDIFDFKTVDLGGVGSFNSRENVITWAGGEVSALKLLDTNQSGDVSFSVQIKESMPIFNLRDKNFLARITVDLETLTIPDQFSIKELRVEKKIICKINTELDLRTKVYYYESNSGIINTGPIPPKVDQLTNYTVHWQIFNTSNDLENIKVETVLPQGTIWSDHYINNAEGSEVYYNERTKEMVWDIGSVPAGTGIVNSLYELIFQIGIVPSINQINTSPILLNQCFTEGKDIFTNKILSDFTREVTTHLRDDPKIGSKEGRVVE